MTIRAGDEPVDFDDDAPDRLSPARDGSPGIEPGPVDPFAVIAAQVQALAAIEPRDLAGTGAMEFFDQAFELSDRLKALAVRALPVIEADGLWATGPGAARTFTSWVANRARVGWASAKRMTRLGAALRDELPLTSAAVFTAGPDRIGLEHAEILTRHAATSDLRRAALVDPRSPVAEEFLLTQARLLGADTFRNLARRWAAAADPDADENGYTDATDKEHLTLSSTTGGYHLAGYLTTEHGQLLLVALDAATPPPAADETRTSAQRRAGALTDLATCALNEGHHGKGSILRPHLNILIDYNTLLALATIAGVNGLLPYAQPTATNPEKKTNPEKNSNENENGTENGTENGIALTPLTAPVLAGLGLTGSGLPGPLNPAMFEDGQPVPRRVLDRLICDSVISRTIFGPGSEILNVGRDKRLYPAPLRRAIINRDTHCQYPTCTAPPRLCQVHHSQHWARDHGHTDAATGVLLCTRHHTDTHDHDIDIYYEPATGWQFTDKHGNPIRR